MGRGVPPCSAQRICDAQYGAVDKVAASTQKCDIIYNRRKRGGGGDTIKTAYDNDRRFGAGGTLSAKVGRGIEVIFRV